MSKFRRGLKQATKETKDWKSRVARIGKVALGVGAAAFAAVLASAAKRAVELAAKFQQTQTAFRAMIGDSQKAAALIDSLVEFSTRTPFTPEQVNKAARTLLVFGFSADEVKDKLGFLGDVAAGTGKDFGELAVIFGQIKGAGRLMGQDLLQLINAGFNPLQVMSEKTGKSMAQLKDEMSKGLITFEQVEDAFRDATSEGGLFFNMMKSQSKTLVGSISTLKGNWDELLKTMGQGTTGVLTKLTNQLNGVAEALLEVEKARERVGKGEIEINEGVKFTDRLKAGAVRIGKGLDAVGLLPERARRGIGVVEDELLASSLDRLKINAPDKEAIEKGRAERQIKLQQDAQRKADEKAKRERDLFNNGDFNDAPNAFDQLASIRKKITDEARAKVLQDQQRAALEGAIPFMQEQAAKLEKEIGMAFRPQGEIGSSLSRIGGERGIAISRNVPEKQLQQLQNINKGIEILQGQLDRINTTPVWPGAQ